MQGLTDLLDDFLTMEMLVYECDVDDSLTFADLQQMADYDKLDLIMSKVTLFSLESSLWPIGSVTRKMYNPVVQCSQLFVCNNNCAYIHTMLT